MAHGVPLGFLQKPPTMGGGGVPQNKARPEKDMLVAVAFL